MPTIIFNGESGETRYEYAGRVVSGSKHQKWSAQKWLNTTIEVESDGTTSADLRVALTVFALTAGLYYGDDIASRAVRLFGQATTIDDVADEHVPPLFNFFAAALLPEFPVEYPASQTHDDPAIAALMLAEQRRHQWQAWDKLKNYKFQTAWLPAPTYDVGGLADFTLEVRHDEGLSITVEHDKEALSARDKAHADNRMSLLVRALPGPKWDSDPGVKALYFLLTGRGIVTGEEM